MNNEELIMFLLIYWNYYQNQILIPFYLYNYLEPMKLTKNHFYCTNV